MVSPGLQTLKAIDGYSLERLIIFYLSLILRAIYDTHSTVSGMRRSTSTLHVNDDMRMKYGTERSMIGIMASLHEVRPLELSRQRLQLLHYPGTVETAHRQLPSPGPAPRSSTRRHMWSICAHSASQGHSMAPKLQGLQRREIRA
jgi:hypothetical protein